MFDKLVKEIPRLVAEYGPHVVGGLVFLLLAWLFARFVDKLLRRVLAVRTELESFLLR